jgi:Transposase DDE domain
MIAYIPEYLGEDIKISITLEEADFLKHLLHNVDNRILKNLYDKVCKALDENKEEEWRKERGRRREEEVVCYNLPKLTKIIVGNKAPDYNNISRRINRLNIKISSDDDNNKSSLHDDYFVIAIDSTGIKVTNRGEWIRHKWNVKRGYLKIHVAVDIKRKRILSLHVTSEEVHDGKVLPELVGDITIKQNKIVNTVIADGSYDSNNNFQFLSFKGIQPAIKVRKNSRCRKTNHYLRNKTVKMQKNNLQEWKDSVSYGQRWIAETVFSCIKRMFGEYVTAIRLENMIKEIVLKASLYNWFRSITIV